MFETQTKKGYEANYSLDVANTKTETSTSVDVNGFSVVGVKGSLSVLKISVPAKETKDVRFSKVPYFKCQVFGHYHNVCPNRRVVTLRDVIKFMMRYLWKKKEVIILF